MAGFSTHRPPTLGSQLCTEPVPGQTAYQPHTETRVVLRRAWELQLPV